MGGLGPLMNGPAISAIDGWVLVREFVHLLPKKAAGVEVKVEVVGVAFIDANQEGSHVLWPNPAWAPIESGLDFWSATGIRAETKLTDEEWEEMASVISTDQYALTNGGLCIQPEDIGRETAV